MPKKYVVRLSRNERLELEKISSGASGQGRKRTHARILLYADVNGPNSTDEEILIAVGASLRTIQRVRKAFTQHGLEAAINHKRPSRESERKINGSQEARLLALARSPAPEGRKRWTFRLLAHKMVELGHVDSLSYETVRRAMMKTRPDAGLKREGLLHPR